MHIFWKRVLIFCWCSDLFRIHNALAANQSFRSFDIGISGVIYSTLSSSIYFLNVVAVVVHVNRVMLPDLEVCLIKWFYKLRAQYIPITNEMIIAEAVKIFDLQEVPESEAPKWSPSWVWKVAGVAWDCVHAIFWESWYVRFAGLRLFSWVLSFYTIQTQYNLQAHSLACHILYSSSHGALCTKYT